MRILLLFCLIILLISCNNNDQTADTEKADTTYINIQRDKPFIENPLQFKNLIWLPVYDSVKGDVSVKQQRAVNADTLTTDKLIREINSSWDGITLEFRKISHDTLYVAIPQSEVLTQQLGSSGAFSYMSSTTFILTEMKDIRYVNYDFEEGDHLAPGTMKRSDFKN